MSPHPKHRLSGFRWALLFLFLLLAAAHPAGAQEEDARTGAASKDREASLAPEADEAAVPEASGDIDEMVVLATGRDDFLKDMSVSMTSFSGAKIKSLRIQNIADLAEYTPNLEINTRSAASNPTLFIRGIGLKDYNANAAGAVAVYQDGININAPAIQLGQLFDLEEIVVLRGPQGSMNGRNATAGAIMLKSVLPDGELDMWGNFTYGNYNNIQAEGAIAFPLVEDRLSTRVAFTANFRDGTTKNNCSKWDPETIDKPLISQKTIEEAYRWNVEENPAFKGVKGDQFPNRNPDRAETDEQLRQMNPDKVCIWNSPGALRFDQPGQIGEAVWVPNDDQNVRTPADFQSLNQKVNDVDNWAGRMILRLTPDVEGMDWIVNGHGGQNLGDSARLQSLGTDFFPNGGDSFFNEKVGEFASEAQAAANSQGRFEGTRVVKGLNKFGTAANARAGGGLGGDDVDAGFYDLDGKERLDNWGVLVRGLWDAGPIKMTSLSGYEWYDRKIDDEGDGVPVAAFPARYEDSAWQVSQELRVAGEGERYRWAVGLFFLHEDLDATNLFPGLRSRRIEQEFQQELTSSAHYANGRYWIFDELYIDGGVRYTLERKKFTLNSTINALNGNFFNAIPEETVARTWDHVTGDTTLGWEPGGDWMYDARLDKLNLYVKYGRGMKGGHFNAGLTIQSNVSQKQRIGAVQPEYIHSLEAGFKSLWFQDRLVVNFALFRYWYEDLQVFDFTNEVGELPIQQLLNSDARVLGAELEIQARPLPGLLLQFGGGWLDTKYKDFVVEKATSQPRGVGTPVEFDYSGNPLISAPQFNFSGIVEYTLPLFGLGSFVPQYDFSYRSKVYLDPQKLDPISQEPFWLHSARLAYRTPDGRFEVSGWVENFMDKRYKIDSFDLSLGQNSILEVWNEPRTYGLTVSAYF